MSRLRRIADRDRVFFVTTNLSVELAQFSPGERDLILGALASLQASRALRLFAYVVMPDHLHLLLAPEGRSLSGAMRDLKSKTGFQISEQRHIGRPIWQARYFDNILRRVRDLGEKLQYIHQNPVEAGFVSRPEDWKWSSYRFYAGVGNPPIPVDILNVPADQNGSLIPGH